MKSFFSCKYSADAWWGVQKNDETIFLNTPLLGKAKFEYRNNAFLGYEVIT